MTNFDGRAVLLDTNLLLLLLIGSIDRKLLTTNKRVRGYSEREFLFLINCLSSAKALQTTQHVCTQTSDLGASSLFGGYRKSFLELLRRIHIQDSDVRLRIPAEELTQPILQLDASVVDELGVADAGLINAALANNSVLFTDDLQLCLRAARHGVEAANFNDLLN